jgi:hypothetical protein
MLPRPVLARGVAGRQCALRADPLRHEWEGRKLGLRLDLDKKILLDKVGDTEIDTVISNRLNDIWTVVADGRRAGRTDPHLILFMEVDVLVPTWRKVKTQEWVSLLSEQPGRGACRRRCRL